MWDLRTGSIFETIHFDHAVTALQFDSRKVVGAAGENGIKVFYFSIDTVSLLKLSSKIYNRTSTHLSTLATNGHTKPVERLRYMDRYLVTGGRDAKIKIWSL